MNKNAIIKGLSIVLPVANIALMLAGNWLNDAKTEEKLAELVKEAVKNQK